MDPVKSMFIKLQRNREKVGLKKVSFYLNLRVIHLTLTAMGGGGTLKVFLICSLNGLR